MKLITIRTFDNSLEAHLIKSKLEEAQIMCFLFDENIVEIDPTHNLAVGGIKLKIHYGDLHRAREILEESATYILTDDQGEAILCPRCQSENVHSGVKSIDWTKGLISAITSILFMILPMGTSTIYVCKECGNQFE